MSFERVKQLVDEADYATHVYPQFWGEPTLHPFFEDIIEYCKLKGKIVSFYTNASLLHTKDVERILRHSDLIHLSIPAASNDGYHAITMVDIFDQVRANVVALWYANLRAQTHCRLVIRATFFLLTPSVKQAFEAFWSPFCHSIKWRTLRNLAEGFSPFPVSRDLHCERIRDHCIVKSDGRMVLCCSDRFGSVPLGNVFERSILEVFNCTTFNAIRTNLGMLSVCQNCWYRYTDDEWVVR